MKDYDIYNDGVSIQFRCPKCGELVTYPLLHTAMPNWEGDTVDESQEIEDEDFHCPNCHTMYNIETIANIYYGEMVLRDTETNMEIEDFDINYNTENNMNTPFENWFSEQVKTQYGDMKGIAYLDGHEGPGEVVKMIKAASAVNVNKYAILGFGISGFEPVGEHIYASVYAVDKRILEAKGSVDNLDFISDIEEFPIEDFNWEILRRYIKRLSIGFILPEHLRDMNKE